MPVSTFSSDNSNVRRNSHSGMIARWSSTRDHMLEDERRVGMNEVMEMDGTGLHERDNWPLVDSTDRNISPETVISVGSPDGSALPSPRSPKHEEPASQNAEVGKNNGIDREPTSYFEDKDVSDIEDDSDEVSEDGTEFLYEDSRGSSPLVPIRDAPTKVSADMGSNSDSSQPVSPDVHPATPSDRREHWRNSHSRRQEGQVDVSPVREGANEDVEVEQAIGTQYMEINNSSDEDETQYMTNGDAEHTARDMPTSTMNNQSTIDPQPSTPGSPQPNGRSTPTTNWHAHRSSIFKGTPPSRSASRRSASISQNVPHDKSKVRYSWQSVEDEEPSRPRIHIIKLVSNTATASAAFSAG